MGRKKGFGKMIEYSLIGILVLGLSFITAPAIISFYDIALDASAGTTSKSISLSSVDSEDEWNNGTLSGLNTSNGILKLSQGQIEGSYVSTVSNISGSIDKLDIDGTVYNTSESSADVVIETSDSFDFSTVQDTVITGISNSTSTVDLSSMSGDYVRVKINMTRQVNGG